MRSMLCQVLPAEPKMVLERLIRASTSAAHFITLDTRLTLTSLCVPPRRNWLTDRVSASPHRLWTPSSLRCFTLCGSERLCVCMTVCFSCIVILCLCVNGPGWISKHRFEMQTGHYQEQPHPSLFFFFFFFFFSLLSPLWKWSSLSTSASASNRKDLHPHTHTHTAGT